MTTENFDYKSFASNMSEQATELLPKDISLEDKEYIETALYKFVIMGGEAICNDKTIDFSPDNAIWICQIIAEWMFHKGVDLAHSAIPKENWDAIMQKITITILEVAKQGIVRNIEPQQFLDPIEQNVKKVWEEYIEDLSERNIIPDSVAKIAKNLSNIDDMVKRAGENERIAKLEKIYNSEDAEKKLHKTSVLKHLLNHAEEKISGFYPLIKFFLQEALYTCLITTIVVCGFIILDKINFFTEVLEHKTIIYIIITILTVIITIFVRCKIFEKTIQKELPKELQELENIRCKRNISMTSMFAKLKVDTITLTIGTGLLQISDVNLEGELSQKIAALRHTLADELGYIVPEIRICDGDELDEYEYTISIRENLVGDGFVYPGKYLVIAEEWDSKNTTIPDDAIVGIDPTYKTLAYWVSRQDAKLNKKITAVDACDVILTHMKEELIKHVEDVISLKEVQKLINYINKKEPRYYKDMKKNGLTNYDLKRIFVNLIREKVSIKDISFVFEKLSEYSKNCKEPNILSERLRNALGRQICLRNSDKDVLYTVTLSQTWEQTLNDSCQETEIGVMFLLEPDKIHDLIESTQMTLTKAYELTLLNPVILCSPKIRLPLYQLLEKHIPAIVVISYSELITDIKVEQLDTIGNNFNSL